MDGTDQRHSPRRLLALSSGRQRCRCATEKRAEIPSPHDSPRAEDYFEYEKNITFLDRIMPFVTPKTAAMSAMGHKRTSELFPSVSALPPESGHSSARP